jgi:hypothetical protein
MACCCPLIPCLPDWPKPASDMADADRLRHGQAVRWSGEEGTRLRVYDQNIASSVSAGSC